MPLSKTDMLLRPNFVWCWWAQRSNMCRSAVFGIEAHRLQWHLHARAHCYTFWIAKLWISPTCLSTDRPCLFLKVNEIVSGRWMKLEAIMLRKITQTWTKITVFSCSFVSRKQNLHFLCMHIQHMIRRGHFGEKRTRRRHVQERVVESTVKVHHELEHRCHHEIHSLFGRRDIHHLKN